MLITQAGETNIVGALDAGADDYMTKPLRVAELLTRVRAPLRRGENLKQADDRPIAMNRAARLAFLNGQELVAHRKRVRPARSVASRAGERRCSRDPDGRALGMRQADRQKPLNMHISTLRRRLDDNAPGPILITTVRGVGFRLQNQRKSKRPSIHS